MDKDIITGRVIREIDDYTIVFNKGAHDGVSKNQKFLVYYNDEELFDPDTKESLGKLEVICGQGSPSHIQEQITTITSSIYEQSSEIRKVTSSTFTIFPTEETIIPTKTPQKFKHLDNSNLLIKQLK